MLLYETRLNSEPRCQNRSERSPCSNSHNELTAEVLSERGADELCMHRGDDGRSGAFANWHEWGCSSSIYAA